MTNSTHSPRKKYSTTSSSILQKRRERKKSENNSWWKSEEVINRLKPPTGIFIKLLLNSARSVLNERWFDRGGEITEINHSSHSSDGNGDCPWSARIWAQTRASGSVPINCTKGGRCCGRGTVIYVTAQLVLGWFLARNIYIRPP